MYALVLLPDEPLGNLISRMRDDFTDIAELPSIPPHITLREDFFSENISGFIKEYQGEISKSKPLKLNIKGVEVFQRGHVVFIIQNNDYLQMLHEKAVKISQKYVSTPRIINFECELNNEQKEMIKKYQLPFYFKYYRPHMTIVKLNDFKDKERILKLINKYSVPKEFEVSNVCVYDKLKHKIHRLIKL